MSATVPVSVLLDQRAELVRLQRQTRALIRTLRAEHQLRAEEKDHAAHLCDACHMLASAKP